MTDDLIAYDRALGADLVIGCDEAGRGCVAGPIVAAGVRWDLRALDDETLASLSGLGDSKKLSVAERERLAPAIRACAAEVFVAARSAPWIDEHGIQAANMGVLDDCLGALWRDGAVAIVDGFAVKDSPVAHRRLVRGDSTSAAVAAASVIAKTTRDAMMARAALRFPLWGFDRHAGYGTARHAAAVAKHGLCALHRRSFRVPGLPE
jgi:ribonuclease HII